MNKTSVFRCDCCGLIVDPEVTEDCPHCEYPVKPEKEERFLESSIRDLKRVSTYGGGSLKVDDLIRRYSSRLFALHHYTTFVAPVVHPSAEQKQVSITPVSATSTVPKAAEVAKMSQSPITQPAPLSEKPVVTPQSMPPYPPRHVFSWREFFADQAINIVASVGAFLLLIGSLSFTITTSNLVAFLVLFVVHAIFGVTGFVTYRFQPFRFVATIYSVIFALLVPLVAYALYKLLIGSNLPISVPILVAIAAIYASVIYVLMAIYQRFIPFAYLGLVALLVADLAFADALKLNYWWWPSMAMILALPAAVCLKRGGEDTLPFKGHWKVLRDPIRYLMYLIVAASLLSLSYMVVYSFVIDFYGSSISELRFSILSLTLLILLWATLSIWLAKLAQLVIVLAFLALASVMALSYALRFEAIGYALAFTGVALLYHGLNRFVGRRLESFGILSLGLDIIALVLVLAVPLISSPFLSGQLFASTYGMSFGLPFQIYQTSWRTLAELVAVSLGIILTLSVTFYRAGLAKTPLKPAWCWLLLLAGFLLNWNYRLIVVLTFNITPVWAFLGLALVLVAVAVIVRGLYSSAWSNPLDVLSILEIILMLSLSLSQKQDVISTLLLFFATLLYAVVLYQSRQNLLFLSLIFALLAIPTLWQRPLIMLLLGICLPLASVAIHRFVTHARNVTQGRELMGQTFTRLWEWPLLFVGLVYGILVSSLSYSNGMSALQYTSSFHLPIAIEIALLAIAWYAASALTRVQWWLIPSVGFAIGALLIPTNSFWVLLVLTPVFALIGVAVGRFADRVWALPYYILAVISAVIAGYTAYTQDHLLVASYALLGFAALAYIVGVIEKDEIGMWIMSAFATWSLIISAGSLGDLYRPPTVALVCAVLGVSVKYFRLEPMPFFGTTPRNKFLTYALPFYATALAAAILTGAYGMSGDINNPFYGAIPDALLVYALVAFVILVIERQPVGLIVVAGSAIWAVLLSLELTAYYLFGTGILMALLGLATGIGSSRMIPTPQEAKSSEPLRQFTWSWPWYLTAAVAAFCIGIWTSLPLQQPVIGFLGYSMLTFTIVAIVIMLVQRIPELLVFPAGLAAATIWLWGSPPLDLVPLMIAYSLLYLVVFASQFIWRIIPPASGWVAPAIPHAVVALGGQTIVVLSIINQGGLSSNGPALLAYVGAGALLELALLLFWYGYLHRGIVANAHISLNDTQKSQDILRQAEKFEHCCYYVAGLLCSLVITWEFSALGQTRFDVLLLAPASYLSVVASFVMRDKTLPGGHWIGQIVALSGALLLLLPALWFSFSDNNLLPTLVLLGESLALLLLGIATRVRIFILGSAALLLVGALRALFLSTPPSLALMLLGVMLVVIATMLFLIRHRLKIAWTQWE